MAAPDLSNWQQLFLRGVGAPVTPTNIDIVNAWQRAEGGTAANNPFNTTLQMPGATIYNTLDSGGHVYSYPTPQEGLQATLRTITSPTYASGYQPIIQALRNSNEQGFVNALGNSPWGSSASLVAKILGAPGPVTPSSETASTPSANAANAANEVTSAINYARRYIGTPYSFGGGSPAGPSYGQEQGANIKGFDCSSLVQAALSNAGVTGVGRTTFDQWGQGTAVGQNQLQPGDVVFFKGSDFKTGANGQILPGHEALYIGNGNVIVAPHTGGQVEVAPLTSFGDYMGARRFVTSAAAGTAAASSAVPAIGHKAFPQPKSPPAPTAPVFNDPGASILNAIAGVGSKIGNLSGPPMLPPTPAAIHTGIAATSAPGTVPVPPAALGTPTPPLFTPSTPPAFASALLGR